MHENKVIANGKLPNDPHFYPDHFGESEFGESEFYEDQYELDHPERPKPAWEGGDEDHPLYGWEDPKNIPGPKRK